MEEKFPQLGIVKEDCFEMGWAESNLYSTQFPIGFYKEEVKSAIMVFVAYGGKMDEILETETPFPHRAGNLYSISYVVDWEEEENKNSEKFMSWVRRIHNYMTPYVSKSPREVYVNFRDLDTGTNEINDKENSHEQAKIWGIKYFKNNFDRLVHVKTMIDPENFFRHEQSVPPLPCLLKKGANSNSLGSL
ncbi:hypothetical protein Goari_027203 [Gossypium aridum]|uniref:Berberine/berberine-like domain-containing protein n=1 Tax=Gossypium aridum TaxID=34290 RepID=A0A7J8YMM5_GOSAI|nr:hypothetical protein [Gossypium aridum]